jgi:hypothetical protein
VLFVEQYGNWATSQRVRQHQKRHSTAHQRFNRDQANCHNIAITLI